MMGIFNLRANIIYVVLITCINENKETLILLQMYFWVNVFSKAIVLWYLNNFHNKDMYSKSNHNSAGICYILGHAYVSFNPFTSYAIQWCN